MNNKYILNTHYIKISLYLITTKTHNYKHNLMKKRVEGFRQKLIVQIVGKMSMYLSNTACMYVHLSIISHDYLQNETSSKRFVHTYVCMSMTHCASE